ncbi:hypothetical protein NP233_g3950 [Leucocoprinus birnbaumii]|uniref:RhoGAP-domain-containing protein n=1 Tax=Leucocoprinus birnbaumii TaxID=56174 RepID=A0AAD5YY01_9AGAR|nr:hypothetical protein NP233_g3950 [Leucocoprinus birnbaumii]
MQNPGGPAHPARSFTSPSSSLASLHPSQSAPSASLSSSQAITVNALLKLHESAQDPKIAALDQAVNERNILSAQNTQLWKLIEKQRSGYNQILKELERVRAERDSYRKQVAALGGAVDKRPKPSTRPSVDAPDANSNPRLQVSRHHSDDNATPRQQPHNLHSSRSYEPLSQRNNDSAHQSNTSSSSRATSPPVAALPTQKPTPAPLIVPQRSSSQPASASTVLTSPEEPHSQSSFTTTRALQFRKGSLTESVSSVSSGTNPVPVISTTQYTQPNAPPVSSGIQITMSPATPQTAGIQAQAQAPTLSAIAESLADPRSSRITLPDEASRYIVNMVDSPVPSPKPEATTFTTTKPRVSSNLVPQQQPQQREEEFLDLGSEEEEDGDEEKEDREEDGDGSLLYGEDEDETDLGSVQDQVKSTESGGPLDSATLAYANNSTAAFSVSDQQSLSGVSTHSNNPFSDAQQMRTVPEESQPQRQQPSPEVVVAQPRIVGGAGGGGVSGQQVPPHQSSLINNSSSALSASVQQQQAQQQQPQQYLQQQQITSSESNYSSTSLPPPYSPEYSQMTQQSAASVHPPPRGDSRLSPEKLPNPHPGDVSTSTLSSLNDMRSLHSNYQQAGQPNPQYRALPLISTDLPTTLIQVSQSFVRPNDRGKEVLYFVITIHPNPNNPHKEPWKVEKMYSDVVALDARVRASVGKSIAKRIVSLPEGKLWKDHAPAKVDQRKAVLEQYLRSLVILSSKSNDEVIAFLTSDIVRETRQPVMQAGHKEGYLTKRGKNFGGWKTRYFVLSGPVLEYYESRGGTHLGSITITGAQIGRQQRSTASHHANSASHANNDNNSHGGNTDEKEYRHAFLIVEAKKGPGGSHPRHVLCAESDEERDAWVDMLVRYFTGTYTEEPLNYGSSAPPPPMQQQQQHDAYVRSGSPVKGMEPSPIDRPQGTAAQFPSSTTTNTNGTNNSNVSARRVLDRLAGLPSSLPDSSSSPLSAVTSSSAATTLGDRPNSEMGHYSSSAATLVDSPEKLRKAQSPERHRKSTHPASSASNNNNNNNPNTNTSNNNGSSANGGGSEGASDRSASPSKLTATSNKVKISGPMNGMPIPSGFNFGGRDKEKEKDEKDAGGLGVGAGGSSERREKARSRFWPGWNSRANGDKQPAPAVIPRLVFGVPLEESLDVSQICNLPSVVFRSIEYLEAKKADQEEGIYRLSGSTAVVKSLRDRFNAEGDVNLLASDEYWDPHAITGLLKSYLRELPASILTRDLHFRFLSVIGALILEPHVYHPDAHVIAYWVDFVDPQERIRELSQLIAALPLANYSLLRALTAHLILIVQNASTNKMTMRNVGIVFSPTLGIPAGVFSLMLGEFNRVFNVDAAREQSNDTEGSAGAAAESTTAEDALRRNSKQYSDAAADQVLGLGGRSLKAPTADDAQSEADDYSVQDISSGTETTGDGDAMTAESVSASVSGGAAGSGHGPSTPIRDGDHFNQQQQQSSSQQSSTAIRISPPDTPQASRLSKAAHTANIKGLNVNTAIAPPRGSSRLSRVPGTGGVVGLPMSPRPPHSPARPVDTAAPSVG